ncbi:cyclin-domain-containing protein [Chlamydoabsidia padenii]|nr:cyclin-domain-containing protein [Chlamydoabsidia padenii]
MFDLAQHPTQDTIRLLASLLERMTTANDQLICTSKGNMLRSSSPTLATNYTLFHASTVPSIDIHSYLCRIMKYCPCANECFLALLVYFDRMSKNALALTRRLFTIDSYNIHRLIITGVMVSSKFFCDIFYTNTRYAKVGGLPVTELNRLEMEFLQLNDYNVSVSINELQRYGDQLLKVGRMVYDTLSLYKYGRSISLGSTALDGFEVYNKHCKSMDQQQQWVDDNHLVNNNIKRHSVCSIINKQQYYPHPHFNLPFFHPNPTSSITTYSSPSQLVAGLDLNNNMEQQDNDWYTPRQTRSSMNLHQQTPPMNHHHHQGSFHLIQQYHHPGGDGNCRHRRLSLTPIHTMEYMVKNNNGTSCYYPMVSTCYYHYPIGNPTPPPSSPSPSYSYLPSSHQLYL